MALGGGSIRLHGRFYLRRLRRDIYAGRGRNEGMAGGRPGQKRGRPVLLAAVRVNDKAYSDFTQVFETEGYKPPNPCPLDGIDHGDSFFGKLTRFFHDLIYKLIHLFEINKNN